MFGSRPGPLRRLSHLLFGLALLGTLWVTSLANLSARPTATAILTDLGAQDLNPYLLTHTDGVFGIGQTQYAGLELIAQARPDQPLPLPGLKAQVLGREIAGQPYATGVRVIYGHVADDYYDGGPGSVFALPPQFNQVVETFGLFALPSASTTPGSSTQSGSSSSVPSLPQIPSFLKPFFYALGLSPTTLTAQGHAQIESILLWWWLAALIFGALAVILNGGSLQTRQSRERSAVVQRALGSLGRPVEGVFDALTGVARRISGVGWATFSGALPGVLLIAAAWFLTFYAYPQQLHPFADALTVVVGAFLPVYGGGLIVGLIIAAAPWLVVGLILLLGALAGALLLLGARRATPAPQPYVPSAQAPAAGYNSYRQPQAGYDAPNRYGAPNRYRSSADDRASNAYGPSADDEQASGYGPSAGYGSPSGYGGNRPAGAGTSAAPYPPNTPYPPNSPYPPNAPYPPYPPNSPDAPDASADYDAQSMPAAPYYSPPPGNSDWPSTPAYSPRRPQQYPPNAPSNNPTDYPPNYPPNYPPSGASPHRHDG